MGIPREPKGNRKQSLRLGGQNHCSGALRGREAAPVPALGRWATRVAGLLCGVASADPGQQRSLLRQWLLVRVSVCKGIGVQGTKLEWKEAVLPRRFCL